MTDREKALEAAQAIISDWEDQARERDVRDPMRATILAEAAIIRAALAMPATEQEDTTTISRTKLWHLNECERGLGEILAVIHGDGGQHQDENGPKASVEIAISKWHDLCEQASAAMPATEQSVDLTDPNVVHANMLRGTIAKPTWAQIRHLYPVETAMPATVDRASWEAGRDAAAYKLSSMCPKCGGEGWLWGHELVEPPDVEGHDDTRYSCDSEVHEYATAIRNLTPPEDKG